MTDSAYFRRINNARVDAITHVLQEATEYDQHACRLMAYDVIDAQILAEVSAIEAHFRKRRQERT